jgi:hypothetical protein
VGSYLYLRYELFRRQAGAAFAPLKGFSLLLVLVAGHALLGLLAPLVLLGFQLFNPELKLAERWPYLQMLWVMMFCWQGAVAWQQKTVAEQYFVESLAPSATVAYISNKLMAMVNQLPVWLFVLPVFIYVLLSGKTLWWADALQLLVVLLVLCCSFQPRQTSWLALGGVFVLPVVNVWSIPLLALMVLDRLVQHRLHLMSFSANSLFRYWLYWFIRQQQNKAVLLLLLFVLALWQYWLLQPLKPDALLFVNSVFIWTAALLCYAQQNLWHRQLKSQHYFWLSWCSRPQRLALTLMNMLPVLLSCIAAQVFFDATRLVCTIALAVSLSLWSRLGVVSVAVCCFTLLLCINGRG